MKSELLKSVKQAMGKCPKATMVREILSPEHIIEVQYHSTVIAQMNFSTMELHLDTGGHRYGEGGEGWQPNKNAGRAIGSTTTRKKINQFLSGLGLKLHVSQTNWKWYIAGKEWTEDQITLTITNDNEFDWRPNEVIPEDYYNS